MALIELKATIENDVIVPSKSIEEISNEVMKGNIIILKNVFDEKFLLDFRKEFLKWSRSVDPIIPSNKKDESYLKENHHRIDDNPPQSETPHRSHFHNLMRLDNLPKELSKTATMIFTSLRDLQNKVSGTNGDFLPTNNPILMRPQIIQYPSGGGYFGEHIHHLEPQKIGLITGLSRKGIDYKIGGTSFKTPFGFIDSGEHDIGDITLFKYNLPHAVTEVDPEDKLDWKSEKGRWTIILPYY
jgi:hypothetical protein